MEDNPSSNSIDSTSIQSNEPKKKVINKTTIFIIVGIFVLIIITGLFYIRNMNANVTNNNVVINNNIEFVILDKHKK